MSEIVLGIGSSHSPLLNSPAEDFLKHAEMDMSGRRLLDKTGQWRSYDELLAKAGPGIREQLDRTIIEERVARCAMNIEHLASVIADARLDALIVVGDDQNEQFSDDNLPAVLIYWGETIENNPLPLSANAPAFWRQARSQYHEPSASRRYPVASTLALHLINRLMDQGFDVSQSKRLSTAHGEGHAFGFVHRRLMRSGPIPIVPVALNTYFAPNQPRPKRCYELGRAIREAVECWQEQARIGIVASGGLSHFVVDEDLDRLIMDACRTRNAEALCSVPVAKLNSGTSEIRNWITVAGATMHLETTWQDYVPCYRSPAGTGCGMAFAVWA